jgi:hypothetical protein
MQMRSSVADVCRYIALYDTKPVLMKVWVPVVTYTVAFLVIAIEVRMAYGFATQK